MKDYEYRNIIDALDKITHILETIAKNTREEKIDEISSRITGFGIEGEFK